MKRLPETEFIQGAFFLLGLELLAAPLALYWWLHGSTERYLWIISGPEPFRYLGSGPLQVWLGLALLAGGALCLLAAALIGRWRARTAP